MRFPLLALVLASVVAAPSLRAQEVRVPDGASQTYVTYTLRAFVPRTDVAVPSVVTQLSNDPHLARLDVRTRMQMDHAVDADFVFGSVEEFVQWRQNAGIMALIRGLEADSIQGVEVALNVRRRALQPFIPARD